MEWWEKRQQGGIDFTDEYVKESVLDELAIIAFNLLKKYKDLKND